MGVREVSAIYADLSLAEADGIDAVRPGYKQTEVGVIPEDWEGVSIGSEVDLLTGFPFPSLGYSSTGTRLLRGSNVKRGVTDWSEGGTQYWPNITGDIKKYLLKVGDIVIAMDGSLVGHSFAMLRGDDVPALLLQRVARVRSAHVAPGFLKAWICGPRFTNHCDSFKTVTAIPHISPGDIRSFKIALPPTKAEQNAIAEALSDADALIESLQQLIAKKRQIKQGAMQALLAGQQRLPGFRREWRAKPLGEFGVFLKGSGVTRDQAQSGSLPCVRYGEIYTTHHEYVSNFTSWISAEVAATATAIKKGDVLFAGSGETKAEIGKCVALVDDIKACAGGDIIIFRPSHADPLFLGYALNTPQVNRQKASRGQGDAVVHISATALAEVLVDLPSPDEQIAIAAILSGMDAEIDALETRVSKTREIKQGMMQVLLTGAIRLPLAATA